MRLVYLFAEKMGPLDEVEVNLCADVRCALEGDSLSVEHGEPLPKNFFRLRSCKREHVTSVSAIVGENGAGKTSVAAFLCRACTGKMTGDFLVVTEDRNHRLHCCGQWNRGALELDPAFGKRQLEKRIPFRFVYLSPHCSMGRRVWTQPGRTMDLSTNGLMRDRGPRWSSLEKLDDFECEQTKWMLEFARMLHDKNVEDVRELGLRLPRGVTVSLHPDALSQCSKRFDFFSDGVSSELQSRDRARFCLLAFFCYVVSLERYLDRVRSANKNAVSARPYVDLIAFAEYLNERLKGGLHPNIGMADACAEIEDYLSAIPKGKSKSLAKMRLLRRLFEKLDELLAKSEDLKTDNGISATGVYVPFEDKRRVDIVLQFIARHAACAKGADVFLFGMQPFMSSGEMAYMSMWGRLNWYFSMVRGKRQDYVVFLDEAETTLHPSWQRRLVRNMIWYFSNYASGKNHLIFATHSPFLLSDIPGRQACFLRYQETEFGGRGTSEIVFSNDFRDSFASNFYDLYRSSFFLPDGPVGAFAQEKVDDLLERIKSGKLLDDDPALVELVGDRIVRGYLKEKMAQSHPDVE